MARENLSSRAVIFMSNQQLKNNKNFAGEFA